MSHRRSKKRRENLDRYRKILAFVLGICLLIGICQPGVLASAMTEPVYKVTFHDMDINGNEWKQSKRKTVSSDVPDSGSIWQVLQGKKRTIGTDKQKIQDCVWYTLDEDGERAVFDLDEPIMENLEVNVDKKSSKAIEFYSRCAIISSETLLKR